LRNLSEMRWPDSGAMPEAGALQRCGPQGRLSLLPGSLEKNSHFIGRTLALARPGCQPAGLLQA
jgi:hypothetical protein